VLPTFLIPLLAGLLLGPGAPTAAARPAVRVAQQAPATAPAADRAAARASSIEAERRRALAERAELQRTLEAQVDEVDRLAGQRASWRRDRQLKDRRAEAHATANRLAAVDRRVRDLAVQLEREHRALLAAVDAEVKAGAASPDRRRRLDGWAAVARRGLQRSRKIILPDHRIDPLADPEDLEFQARRIAASEQELEREVAALIARARRYHKMDELRQKRTRASELGGLDDNRPRRSTGRISTQGERDDGPAAGFDNESDDSGAPSPEDPGLGADSDPVVVLADVVDAGTLDALRRAESSGDPLAKARAAERAQAQVRAQLERLRRTRTAIDRRIRELRGNR